MIPNLTGKKFYTGAVTVEVTRQTNYGLTVEPISGLPEGVKSIPQDYSWEQIVAMAFGIPDGFRFPKTEESGQG